MKIKQRFNNKVKSTIAPLALMLQIKSVCVFFILCFASLQSVLAADLLTLPDIGDYEIYSMAGTNSKNQRKSIFRETARNSLNYDGLTGFFYGTTADKLKSQRMFTGIRMYHNKLLSRFGRPYKGNDHGFVTTLDITANYIGEWAEWSVTVPIHDYSLAAPNTYGTQATENEGLGDLKLAWKATYLPERSYYRFAYGVVVYTSTGDGNNMRPAGPKDEEELKLFGCVTTKETDSAVGNLELGCILNSRNNHNRFIYRVGMSYEAGEHTTLIGELVGEVEGEDDRDTLDWVSGIRLSPSPTSVFEMAYVKNLRTYREYGWDERWQCGLTIRW